MSDDDIKRPLQDGDDELDDAGENRSKSSNQSGQLTTRQYFLVNLSKFIVEMLGTCVLGCFYILMGDQQTGVLLGMWVIILFAEAISGAYFNPCITLVFMLRKGEGKLGKARLKGLFYIAAQFAGGILAGLLSYVLADASLQLSPMIYFDSAVISSTDGQGVVTYKLKEGGTPGFHFKIFQSWVSETIGTFVFVFLFMICTDKSTQFSQDKVINCFIMAASYVAARLISGGALVTCLVHNSQANALLTPKQVLEELDVDRAKSIVADQFTWGCNAVGQFTDPAYTGQTLDHSAPSINPLCTKDTYSKTQLVHKVGPLLNPAIALGQMICKANFTDIQYFLCPFGGCILALIFYEFVFVRSQEYLKEGSSDSNPEGSQHSQNEPLGEINDSNADGMDTLDDTRN